MDTHARQTLLKLAREAIRSTLDKGPSPLYEALRSQPRPPFDQELGLFVTLNKSDGQLRGCIGNLWGKGPLYEEVPALARQSAFNDPRFSPVSDKELEDLVIEISLLSSMQSIDHWSKIRLGIDGVLLCHGYHRAVFLPQVALEQGWDLQTMLSQLCRKAGLWPNAYRDSACRFEVFQAEVFSEAEM